MNKATLSVAGLFVTMMVLVFIKEGFTLSSLLFGMFMMLGAALVVSIYLSRRVN